MEFVQQVKISLSVFMIVRFPPHFLILPLNKTNQSLKIWSIDFWLIFDT